MTERDVRCPRCGSFDTNVKDSRAANAPMPARRRRRECETCKGRFSTYEIAAHDIDDLIRRSLEAWRDTALVSARDHVAYLEELDMKLARDVDLEEHHLHAD